MSLPYRIGDYLLLGCPPERWRIIDTASNKRQAQALSRKTDKRSWTVMDGRYYVVVPDPRPDASDESGFELQ